MNRPAAARRAVEIFFPQRIALRIEGCSCSPAVLEKRVLAAAHAPSFSIGAMLLEKVGEVTIGSRGLNKTAVKLGAELVQRCASRLQEYFDQRLPRKHTEPTTPISLACVSVDGGRMQTRATGNGPGVHQPHWRETKNALFLRMQSDCFTKDPHPDLPACFVDRQRMKSLFSGVGQEEAREDDAKNSSERLDHWRPQRLFRTCLSSLADSDAFGRMMEVEADERGFYHAQKKAFVGDGLPYNWAIQQRHFRDFTPILDFVHAVERIFEAARCLHPEDADMRWDAYVRWGRLCWRGQAAEVLDQLKERQHELGTPPKDCEKSDPRKVFQDAIGYLQNNISRMKYAEYRRQGLPTTSSLMESLVKELNARVKGTEKFWNDGDSGEAILHLRAAALCDDDRLTKFLRNRPGNPFHPNVKATSNQLSAAA